ncbi:hypothetical protein [Streptomyces antibioticus]|uniref:hypothetical protein n=1 Tax=Streptomyces antibioticus TaxID=1890 RepID=UPI003F4C7B3B
MTVGVVAGLLCMPTWGRWPDRGARCTAVAASLPVRVLGARTLPRATTVTVPYVAHVAFAESPCAQMITRSFFDAPTSADTFCLAGRQPPRFEIAP